MTKEENEIIQLKLEIARLRSVSPCSERERLQRENDELRGLLLRAEALAVAYKSYNERLRNPGPVPTQQVESLRKRVEQLKEVERELRRHINDLKAIIGEHPLSSQLKPVPNTRPVDFEPTTKHIRIMKAFENKCFYCGLELSYQTLSVDHLVPRNLGGTNALENLVAACVPCNSRKGSRMPTEDETQKIAEIWKAYNETRHLRSPKYKPEPLVSLTAIL